MSYTGLESKPGECLEGEGPLGQARQGRSICARRQSGILHRLRRGGKWRGVRDPLTPRLPQSATVCHSAGKRATLVHDMIRRARGSVTVRLELQVPRDVTM